MGGQGGRTPSGNRVLRCIVRDGYVEFPKGQLRLTVQSCLSNQWAQGIARGPLPYAISKRPSVEQTPLANLQPFGDGQTARVGGSDSLFARDRRREKSVLPLKPVMVAFARTGLAQGPSALDAFGSRPSLPCDKTRQTLARIAVGQKARRQTPVFMPRSRRDDDLV